MIHVVLNGLVVSFFPLAVLVADHTYGDFVLTIGAIVIYALFAWAVVLFIGLSVFGRRGASQSKQPANPILVDGSNVMHWGGEPSLAALAAVLGNLRDQGYTPLVYFDANVGYKLFDEYANGRALAGQLFLERWQVEVVPSGVVADERLLERATHGNMQIVTNDRFRDWQERYPRIGEHGFLIKGCWTQQGVVWRFPQDLALLTSA